MNGGPLPKRIVFGNIEGAVRRGWGGKEKEWNDCVLTERRRPGVWRSGGPKATALLLEAGEGVG